ncbi:iron ABC transporter permease [Pseudomonas syringae]|uniref:iron ABC transporter permease n=1 Tax=Pseudomonas syringae TaxID=317 RepID=UPI000CDAE465|nr:iron ABC transporter permease [Pseudomonas syringae]POP63760.1 Fe(3+)-hydroxamate ABC transporter permease FhuB [Pseudomonas syringae]
MSHSISRSLKNSLAYNVHNTIPLVIILIIAVVLHLLVDVGSYDFSNHIDPYDVTRFYQTNISRCALAVIVGFGLAVSGCVLQLTLRNQLVSPMTLGIGSGAWLFLVIGGIYYPKVTASYGEWIAMSGAMFALLLVAILARVQNSQSTIWVLAGMTLSLVFGALATSLTLINREYVTHLFVWGAGDLTQIDWSNVLWVSPKILIVIPFLILSNRAYRVISLGSASAQSLGLNVKLFIFFTLLGATWISSVCVTAVGLIGFIGLAGPNLALRMNHRSSGAQIICSGIIGSILMLAGDGLASYLTLATKSLVPTGATVALIGAPILIIVLLRQREVFYQESSFDRAIVIGEGKTKTIIAWLFLSLIVTLIASVYFSLSLVGGDTAQMDLLTLSLRWPRLLMSMSAGLGLSAAGAILQILLRNPMASPDVMGLSSAVTLAVVGGTVLGVVSGPGIFSLILGIFAIVLVLLVLLGLNRGHVASPTIMALTGITLSAILTAIIQILLSKGTPQSFNILSWVSGTTYGADSETAWHFGFAIGILIIAVFTMLPKLQIVMLGDLVAQSLGVNIRRTRIIVISIAGLICALTTSILGPISFVGLLGPVLSRALGAYSPQQQVICSMCIGGLVMLLSEWLANSIVYPRSLPVGLVASCVCGTSYILLMLTSKVRV